MPGRNSPVSPCHRRWNTKTNATLIVCLAAALSLAAPAQAAPASAASTPPELVTAYGSLADSILAVKKTEHDLVKSILAATYRHAEIAMAAAKAAMAGGQNAREATEKVAALVSQLGNEGDAAVAAVRTRLLEGGHHHNAEGEKQGIYDPGYVIITRTAKKAFLDSAMRIGKLAAAPDAKALESEWGQVTKQYNDAVK